MCKHPPSARHAAARAPRPSHAQHTSSERGTQLKGTSSYCQVKKTAAVYGVGLRQCNGIFKSRLLFTNGPVRTKPSAPVLHALGRDKTVQCVYWLPPAIAAPTATGKQLAVSVSYIIILLVYATRTHVWFGVAAEVAQIPGIKCVEQLAEAGRTINVAARFSVSRRVRRVLGLPRSMRPIRQDPPWTVRCYNCTAGHQRHDLNACCPPSYTTTPALAITGQLVTFVLYGSDGRLWFPCWLQTQCPDTRSQHILQPQRHSRRRAGDNFQQSGRQRQVQDAQR